MRITVEWRMDDGDEAPLIFKRVYRFEPQGTEDIQAISEAIVDVDLRVRPIAMRHGSVWTDKAAIWEVNPLPEVFERWRQEHPGGWRRGP